MSFGSTAYASFARISLEMNGKSLPNWDALSHVKRIGWEAAAQAVAMAVLPSSLNPLTPEDDSIEDEDSPDA